MLKKMEQISEGPIIERHFGHITILWEITNFCFETCKEGFLISSPEFFVDGLYVTKWKIILNTKSKQYNENCVVLSLERTGPDTEPDYVYVDLNIAVMSNDGTEWNKTYTSKFARNDSHKIPVWRIVDILKMLYFPSSSHYGTLAFHIHMIVDFDSSSTDVNQISDNGLKTLSEDLINLYKVGNNYDIILKLNRNDIYAHKAILCSRSKVLTAMIENTGKEMVLDWRHYDYETMHNLIEYFYSGNIDYITKRPSLEMYNYIVNFDIPELRQVFNVHELQIVSDMEVQDHTFLWTARDFRKFTGDCIVSPVLASDYMDAAWRLSVCENSMSYVTIHADVVRGTMPKRGFVEFSVGNNDSNLWTKSFQLPDKDTHRIGDEHFIKRKSLDCILDQFDSEDLNIAFTVKIHTGIVSSRIKYTLRRTPEPLNRFYLMFSKFLWYLYEAGKYVDVTIEVDGDSFRAHKCILSARSPAFANLFKETTDDKVLLLSVKSRIFSIILNYIYTGIFENFMLEDVDEIYRAADKFSLTTLKHRCSIILRENLNAETVHDVLMLAEEKDDTDLKNAALDLINRYGCNSNDDEKCYNLMIGNFEILQQCY